MNDMNTGITQDLAERFFHGVFLDDREHTHILADGIDALEGLWKMGPHHVQVAFARADHQNVLSSLFALYKGEDLYRQCFNKLLATDHVLSEVLFHADLKDELHSSYHVNLSERFLILLQEMQQGDMLHVLQAKDALAALLHSPIGQQAYDFVHGLDSDVKNRLMDNPHVKDAIINMPIITGASDLPEIEDTLMSVMVAEIEANGSLDLSASDFPEEQDSLESEPVAVISTPKESDDGFEQALLEELSTPLTPADDSPAPDSSEAPMSAPAHPVADDSLLAVLAQVVKADNPAQADPAPTAGESNTAPAPIKAIDPALELPQAQNIPSVEGDEAAEYIPPGSAACNPQRKPLFHRVAGFFKKKSPAAPSVTPSNDDNGQAVTVRPVMPNLTKRTEHTIAALKAPQPAVILQMPAGFDNEGMPKQMAATSPCAEVLKPAPLTARRANFAVVSDDAPSPVRATANVQTVQASPIKMSVSQPQTPSSDNVRPPYAPQYVPGGNRG